MTNDETERLHCVYCDSPVPYWTETKYYFLKDQKRRDDVERETNGIITSVRYIKKDDPRYAETGERKYRDALSTGFLWSVKIWDGVTYRDGFSGPTKTPLFCTSRCAGLFGVASYKAGMRVMDRQTIPRNRNT